MIKTVIVGTSGHYKDALAAIKNGINAKIYAVAKSPDGSLDNEGIRQLNIPVYDDYRQMYDEIKPDIAIINPQFNYTSECIEEALTRDISVFCEKPMSITWDGLYAIKNVATKSKSRICAMMGMRGESPFRKLKKIITDGILGNIRIIHAQKSYQLGNRPRFYHNRETYGGTIPWVGSHPIDMIYWLSGRKKYKSVAALHSKISNSNHGDLEATAAILFEMEDEIITTINIDYLRPGDSLSHGDDRIRVMGDKGWAEILDGKLFLNNEQIMLGDNGNIFSDLCCEISGGTKCSISNEDSLYITEICLRARDSADKHTKIEI